MKRKSAKFRSGFNLIETVIASTLLAGAVMTIGTLGAKSITAVRVDQETEKAWELVDFQLMIIDAMGIQSFLEGDVTSGSFKQDENYQWSLQIQETDIDNLYLIHLEVSWFSGDRPRQITCQTRLCDTTEMLLPNEQPQQPQQPEGGPR